MALRPQSPKHMLYKVYRWAILLSKLDFSIAHLDGHKKIVADMLTRWIRRHRKADEATSKIALLYNALVPEWNQVSIREREGVWKAVRVFLAYGVVMSENGVYQKDDAVWIPEEALYIQLRFWLGLIV